MLTKIRNTRAGFTLVEIMIVVAIIALLAAIAVPGFLRSRKRSQATAVLNDARVIDGAIDQYAIETNKAGNTTVPVAALKNYFKPNSRLYTAAGAGTLKDVLGNTYSTLTFDSGVKVDTNTVNNFSDVIDDSAAFWGAYK